MCMHKDESQEHPGHTLKNWGGGGGAFPLTSLRESKLCVGFCFCPGPCQSSRWSCKHTHTHTRTHTRTLRHFLLFFFKMLPVTELMADVTFFQLTQPIATTGQT